MVDGLKGRLTLAGALSLLAWVLLQWLSPPAVIPWTPTMSRASEIMAAALETTGTHCRTQGIGMDPMLDPSATCLVGPQLTPLFTTLGQLEAKRTTLTPDLAGLLVHLLREAGVESGDTVAVGASGSFPGLLVATLSAAEALDAVPLTILSLGASSYGATRPGFHLLDLHLLLMREGILHTPPSAVSLGGEGDVGREFPPELRSSLTRQVRAQGILVLEEDSLPANVARRMDLFGRPEVFVNVGGAEANLGTSFRVLDVPPGLSPNLSSRVDVPPARERGVLFEMASRGIPVIHLLNIRGLALSHGLPWDPLSLPEAGTTKLRTGAPAQGPLFWFLTAFYLLGLALIPLHGFFPRRTVRRQPPSRSLIGKS